MSKYELFWKKVAENGNETQIYTFEDVRSATGYQIEHSFLTYKKELLEFGYEVSKISVKNKTILIKKLHM